MVVVATTVESQGGDVALPTVLTPTLESTVESNPSPTAAGGMNVAPTWDEILASNRGIDWSLISDGSITTCVDISEITSRILLRHKVGQRFSSITVRIVTMGYVVFSPLPGTIPTVLLTHESDTTGSSRGVFRNVPNLCIYNGFSDVTINVIDHHFTCKCNGDTCDELFIWIWPESVRKAAICDNHILK